jgi:hypothetical protein
VEGSGRDLFETISSQIPGETVEVREKPGVRVRNLNFQIQSTTHTMAALHTDQKNGTEI